MMQTSCLCHHQLHRQHFDRSSDDNFFSSISYPKIFGYLIPTLAAVMGAYVQGTTKPLMETHEFPLWKLIMETHKGTTKPLCVSLVAIIIYYIAFAADNMSHRYQTNSSRPWGLIAVIFGSLSAVSLVSTFFTHSVAEIICYIALSCTPIIMVVYQYGRNLMDVCHWLYHKILKLCFYNILNWFQPYYNSFFSPEQQQRPAV